MQMPKIASWGANGNRTNENDDKEEEDNMDQDHDANQLDPGRSISKLKQKLKIVKKTSKRERILKRNMNAIKKKYNHKNGFEGDRTDHNDYEDIELAKQHVDPIRLLRDPQQFVERLFAKLQRTSERFEIRILYLNVLARVIG